MRRKEQRPEWNDEILCKSIAAHLCLQKDLHFEAVSCIFTMKSEENE